MLVRSEPLRRLGRLAEEEETRFRGLVVVLAVAMVVGADGRWWWRLRLLLLLLVRGVFVGLGQGRRQRRVLSFFVRLLPYEVGNVQRLRRLLLLLLSPDSLDLLLGGEPEGRAGRSGRPRLNRRGDLERFTGTLALAGARDGGIREGQRLWSGLPSHCARYCRAGL